MPFEKVLPLIVKMDDAVFWAVVNWLAASSRT